MNAISLHQPWASLIGLGHKRIETRGWRPPAHALGQPLLIHAAKHWPPAYDDLIKQEPFASCLKGIDLPKGALVGVATLVGHYPSEQFKTPDPTYPGDTFTPGNPFFIGARERDFGDYGPNRHGWHLTNVR